MASTSSLGSSSSASASQAATFYKDFNEIIQDLTTQTESVADVQGLSEILTRASSARAVLQASTSILPARDQETHQTALKRLLEGVEARRKHLHAGQAFSIPPEADHDAPKTGAIAATNKYKANGGFAFRRKAKPAPTTGSMLHSKSASPESHANAVATQLTDEDSGVRPMAPSSSKVAKQDDETLTSHLRVSSIQGRHIAMSDLRLHSTSHSIQEQEKDLHLLDLTDCLIDLRATSYDPEEPPKITQSAFAALQLRRLSRCILLLPRISGAVMLHDLHDCFIRVECGQFRMHTSSNNTILLRLHSSASVATIEQCKDISFGAQSQQTDEAVSTLIPGKEEPEVQVQDFDRPFVPIGNTSESWSVLMDQRRRNAERLSREVPPQDYRRRKNAPTIDAVGSITGEGANVDVRWLRKELASILPQPLTDATTQD
ncbi:Beta-tubulin folding cofactor C [Ceraceosorus bombacis]|uniref:Beta-tubulin folding cofactor C n=1 Tax=Ceraceosorus bombacis TaxID=401625 RepID=A0A0P1BHY7_9BASI|nr:Beta-tubulin folding cofactor C [Ceraceosorus bombacis]